MVRLNMFLLLAVVVCALSVVTSQHKARKLFQALESEQDRARQLDVEFGQLQLELSTWATSPRIEKIARDKLRMRTPEAAKIITATSGVLQQGASAATSGKDSWSVAQ
jgi:cell division protein FtsL